jgi:hypothetical protein
LSQDLRHIGVGDGIVPIVSSGTVINPLNQDNCCDCVFVILAEVFQHLGLFYPEGKRGLNPGLYLLLKHFAGLVIVEVDLNVVLRFCLFSLKRMFHWIFSKSNNHCLNVVAVA